MHLIWFSLLALLVAGSTVWAARLFWVRRGGKVEVAALGKGDLICVFVLIGLMANVILVSLFHKLPVDEGSLWQEGLFDVLLLGGLGAFLAWRRISPIRLFGLNRMPWLKSLLLALAALLVVQFCGLLVFLTGIDLSEQTIVSFFSEALKEGRWGTVSLTVFFAVCWAPFMEEVLFRGYLYGTLRRWFGFLPALLFSAALFASVHLSLPVLLPLFLFAVCLTLAYEETGTLWTPVLMHALFNATMLAGMFFQSLHSA